MKGDSSESAVGSPPPPSTSAAPLTQTNPMWVGLRLESELYSHGLVTKIPCQRPDPYRESRPTITKLE